HTTLFRSPKNITTRCGSRAGPPQLQFSGALASTSPNCRERLSWAMPARNSCENSAITDSDTPRAPRPEAVNATCRAVLGGGLIFTALVTGAELNQARAAAASFTRSSAYEALVIFPY